MTPCRNDMNQTLHKYSELPNKPKLRVLWWMVDKFLICHMKNWKYGGKKCKKAKQACSLSARLILKVSKSQKYFFLKLHCPNIRQNSALCARAEFCQIFRSFFSRFEFFWNCIKKMPIHLSHFEKCLPKYTVIRTYTLIEFHN